MNALVNLSKLIQSAKEIFPFHGGVHPPENKAQSTQLPIAQLSLPQILVLPIRQHVGNLPKISVLVGEQVLKGQLLAEAEGAVSAAIHAPTSGIITAIADAVIPHPSGLPDMCISLQPDGKDQWIARQAQDWKNTDRKALVASLRNSGIVGLGGATFPTQIKLRTDGKSTVHTLIINAAECEPYISCDDMLMRERAAEIVQGIGIAQYLLGAEKVLIGIEDNKPEAIVAMQAATAGTNMQVKTVPTLYPSGDARRLVYLLLGEEIPHNKRSTEVGLQVFNVATVLALHRYFHYGEPSIGRIVSMTGNVQQPQNFEVLFGTPLSHLIAAAGGAKADTSHFIMGGPMMGFDLPNTNVPITKAANCIIAVSPTLFAPPPPAMPCIRCARCADVCPVNLQPQELYWFAKSDHFEKARDYKLFDCIECGACSYVCPSDIPLVQYYRYAKSEIITTDKAKEAASLARERNEARLARIEREKTERAQKHAERAAIQKEEAAKKATENAAKDANIKAPINVTGLEHSSTSTQANTHAGAGDAQKAAKQAAIAAAIERAKAAKAALASGDAEPKNVSTASELVQKEIAEIDARRAAVGLEQVTESAAKPPVDAQKQAKIAAAIERAKAAKAAASAITITPVLADSEQTVLAQVSTAKVEHTKEVLANEVLLKEVLLKEVQAKAAPVEKVAKIKTATQTPTVKKPRVAKAIGATRPAAIAKPSAPAKSVVKVEDDKPFKIMTAMARAKADKVTVGHMTTDSEHASTETINAENDVKENK